MQDIKKNTVPAANQNKNNFVFFENENGKGKRVLFVGNSMTKHAPKADIGWNVDHGMAASAKENDFVHVAMKKVNEKYPDSVLCIAQVAEWERQYKNGSTVLELYKAARDFAADIIIFRFVENCPWNEYESEVFLKEYEILLNYLNSTGKAEIVLTDGFWRHPADSYIAKFGKEKGYPVICLGDLGDDDNMKAIGKFEHEGVALHPGDLGMKMIAERILAKLFE